MALYAVSQALLQAVAMERRKTCAEILAEELWVAVSQTIIPIYVQCGDGRHDNVDKAILKQADVLPHGLINDIDTTLGRQGELLAEYVGWIVSRIRKFGSRRVASTSCDWSTHRTVIVYRDNPILNL